MQILKDSLIFVRTKTRPCVIDSISMLSTKLLTDVTRSFIRFPIPISAYKYRER